jgi:hypothetical protein
MLLGPIFDRFVQRSPFAVMSRAILEHVLCPAQLDELFERQAETQYTRELLFSSIVDLLSLVVTRTCDSVRAAYVDEAVDISVSLTSVCNKLQGVEDPVCAELVRHTANRLQPVVSYLGGNWPEPIPGFRMRVLDGNHLSGTEHLCRRRATTAPHRCRASPWSSMNRLRRWLPTSFSAKTVMPRNAPCSTRSWPRSRNAMSGWPTATFASSGSCWPSSSGAATSSSASTSNSTTARRGSCVAGAASRRVGYWSKRSAWRTKTASATGCVGWWCSWTNRRATASGRLL